MKRILYLLLLLITGYAKAQQPVGRLKTFSNALNTLRDNLSIEKLYLQLDKPYYSLGDTLRFKAYLLNADFLTPGTRSGLLYVELDDLAGRMVKRIMTPLSTGVSWGDIALHADNKISAGSYTLRAYTNWMRNFGEDYVFKQNLYVSPTGGGSTLINASFKLDSVAGKNKVYAGMHLTNLDKDALRLKGMRLQVLNGKRTLFRDKLTTGMDGSININFDLADKTAIKNLSIQLQNIGKGTDTAMLTIPVTISRPENTDVQFMPEGGNMVAGIPIKIGFKAIGEDGKSAAIKGKIYNSKQQEIIQFQTTHEGMGSFELTPELNESYTATITLANSITKTYPLPAIRPAGTTLRITTGNNDSLEVTVNATANVATDYYLIGQARGVVCYATHINLNNGKAIKHIAKNIFPAGITRFTLLNANNQPLNERIIYINHDDNLQITLSPSKGSYTIRDSIALAIAVNDKDGKPVQGTFSLAVTDDDQVRADSLGSNIINNMLFTSDLKGTVEEAGWYLENSSPDRTNALDNLLLTQGWVGYSWADVFSTQSQLPKYKAEAEFTVQGKLTNIFNKPLKNAGVSLLQKKPFHFADTVTDNEGRFTFRGKSVFPVGDSVYYLVEAKKKDGLTKGINVGIDVEEPTFPQFTGSKMRLSPWYFNSDTILLNNANTRTSALKAIENYKGEGTVLKEVVIKDQKIIAGSHNLNGPGGADITIDEKELNKEQTHTLFEVLKHRFKDFHKAIRWGKWSYALDYHGTVITDLVIDGMFISYLEAPQDLYLEGLTAADIKGIEIMTSAKYGMAYPAAKTWLLIPQVWVTGDVNIEITTYSGSGAFIKNKGGRYVYKPLPFSPPTGFYRPKYTAKNINAAMGTDLRSTLHWEPNVVTDSLGKATVSFFGADKPAGYTIIIEGTDLEGNLGYKRQKIKIMPKPTMAK